MNTISLWLNQTAVLWSGVVLNSLWQCALVGLVVLGLLRWGRRWPAPVRYGLLLLALAKFAMPPLWPVSAGLFGMATPLLPVAEPIGAFWAEPQSFVSLPEPKRVELAADSVDQSVALRSRSASADSIANSVAEVHPTPAMPLSWRAWLMLIHLAGTLAITTWILGQWVRLRHLTRQGEALSNSNLLAAADTLAARLGMKRLPRLLVLPLPCSPMAFGIFHPTILVPTALTKHLSSREIEAILGHELAHIRRGDLWVNSAQLLIWAVWWFHPVLWLVNRALRQVREDCCDDLLLTRGITASSDYCDILLRASRELISHRPVAPSLGCAEKLHPLGERVVRLMDRRIPRWARQSASTLVGTMFAGFLLLPGLRIQENPASRVTAAQPSRAGAPTLSRTSAFMNPSGEQGNRRPNFSGFCRDFQKLLSDKTKTIHIIFEYYPPPDAVPAPIDAPLTEKMIYEGYWNVEGYRLLRPTMYRSNILVTNFSAPECGRYKGTYWKYNPDTDARPRFRYDWWDENCLPKVWEGYLLRAINMGVDIGTNGIVWKDDEFRGVDIFGKQVRGTIAETDGDRASKVVFNHFIHLSYEYGKETRSPLPTSIKGALLNPKGECVAPIKYILLKYEVLDAINLDGLLSPNIRNPQIGIAVKPTGT